MQDIDDAAPEGFDPCWTNLILSELLIAAATNPHVHLAHCSLRQRTLTSPGTHPHASDSIIMPHCRFDTVALNQFNLHKYRIMYGELVPCKKVGRRQTKSVKKLNDKNKFGGSNCLHHILESPHSPRKTHPKSKPSQQKPN